MEVHLTLFVPWLTKKLETTLVLSLRIVQRKFPIWKMSFVRTSQQLIISTRKLGHPLDLKRELCRGVRTSDTD